MSGQKRQQVEELFQRLVELLPTERNDYLDENCTDPEVRDEVEKLLAYDNIEGGGLTDQFDDRHMPTKGMLQQSVPGRGNVSLPASGSPLSSGSSIDHGRFLPGTVLSARYRIVGMLGKGGMGEVYRADDLELGQSVALKFLPKKVADDPRALERFRGEVRLARQVSHPNVCRVYDIGQIDGQWFLSMEYVDGEDLAQLLTRIGRFNSDRATELARQLCLGLHAAHEKGVLHRDLKPSNIMIDGRGKLLITDFGLAEIADDVRDDDIRSGTPAYMSPEQLAGREVTKRSDIYSLGIILHEIYTGKPVWQADSMAELFEKRKSGTAPTPTSHFGDLDTVVDSVIQRCLEPDPAKRPSSALSVTAALPGGDPLAAALAAGETPSPQMVANSNETVSISPRIALIALIVAFVALFLNIWAADSTSLVNRSILPHEPAVLNDEVQEMIREEFGYTEAPGESIYGFGEFPNHVDRDAAFWYRQRPVGFDYAMNGFWSSTWGQFGWARPDFFQPSEMVPKEINVLLSGNKKLLYFRAAHDRDFYTDSFDSVPCWSEIFTPERTGYYLPQADGDAPESVLNEPDIQILDVVHNKWWPPIDGWDALAVWRGQDTNGETFLIEAASFRGRPTYFQKVYDQRADSPFGWSRQGRSGLITGALLAIIFIGIVLAWHNIMNGRGDRVGARRIAIYVGVLNTAVLLAFCRFSPEIEQTFAQVYSMGGAHVLLVSAQSLILYLAFEPYVRRVWPQILIGLSRILEGRWQDRLVGRDILMGVLFSLFSTLAFQAIHASHQWMGNEEISSLRNSLFALSGTRELIGTAIYSHASSFYIAAVTMMFLLVTRILLKSERWAIVVTIVLLIVMVSLIHGGNPLVTGFWIGVHCCFVLLVLVRYGILSLMVFFTNLQLLQSFPITLDSSHWYFGYGMFAVVLITLVAIYGFVTAVGGISSLKKVGL